MKPSDPPKTVIVGQRVLPVLPMGPLPDRKDERLIDRLFFNIGGIPEILQRDGAKLTEAQFWALADEIRKAFDATLRQHGLTEAQAKTEMERMRLNAVAISLEIMEREQKKN